MTETVLAQIAALKTRSIPELRDMWRELFDREPPILGRRYLEDRLAYRLQELRLGGLSDRARRRLDALADQLEPKAARRRDPGRPIAGTQLVREWQGMEHVVTVREHDFEYNGRPYKSLSAVARAINESRWNGPLFFGLRPSGRANERSAAQATVQRSTAASRARRDWTRRSTPARAARELPRTTSGASGTKAGLPSTTVR